MEAQQGPPRVIATMLYTGEPPVKWEKPWTYEDWKAVILADGRDAFENMLEHFFKLEWEPHDCVQMMLINKLFEKRSKRRLVHLPADRVQQRIALAIWRECSRLMARRLTPEARAIVVETQERVKATAGI